MPLTGSSLADESECECELLILIAAPYRLDATVFTVATSWFIYLSRGVVCLLSRVRAATAGPDQAGRAGSARVARHEAANMGTREHANKRTSEQANKRIRDYVTRRVRNTRTRSTGTRMVAQTATYTRGSQCARALVTCHKSDSREIAG